MVRFAEDMDRLLDTEMKRNQLPYYDCAVYHRHKEVYRRYRGFADPEALRPVGRDTLYNIYSNTKVIVCAAALQLYEKGLFLLEDPIGRFFPEMAEMWVRTPQGLEKARNPITVRDVFRMTAGFGEGQSGSDLLEKLRKEGPNVVTAGDLPRFLAEIPLEFEPGSRYLYGICHELLAAMIEKLSGQRFPEYLKEHIFRPLGMEDTGFDLWKDRSGRIAKQFRYNGAGKPLTDLGNRNFLVPPFLVDSASGGLIASVDDYMKFLEGLCVDGAVLRKSTVELMRMNQLEGGQWDGYGYTPAGYGYGLGVRTIVDQAKAGSPVGFGPFGWGGAGGSYNSADPENEICIFYMQQVFNLDGQHTQDAVKNLVYSALL